MADDVKVEGLAQLKAALGRLPGRLGDKVVLAALRAAAQVIRKDAQARAPRLAKPDPRRKAGTVQKAITVKRSKKDKHGVYVGVKQLGQKQIAAFKTGGGGKSANNPDDPFYWIFLEFGTAKMAARPFLRPAFEANKFVALRRFEEYAKKRIAAEAEKLGRETRGAA